MIRVQPSGADILIDGERWQGPEGDERLIVQVSEGPHRIEVQKAGYRPFTTEIQARRGETVPVNVALTAERDEASVGAATIGVDGGFSSDHQ
jgi:hypothetical protein